MHQVKTGLRVGLDKGDRRFSGRFLPLALKCRDLPVADFHQIDYFFLLKNTNPFFSPTTSISARPLNSCAL